MTDQATEGGGEAVDLPNVSDHSLSDLRKFDDSALGAALQRLVRSIDSTDDCYAAFSSAVPRE